MNTVFFENIKIALNAIRSHILRTILTMLIIAIGIMALVGILTAIDSLKSSISSNFTQMGANSFSIEDRGMHVHMGRRGNKPKFYPTMKYSEVVAFKDRFAFPADVSISTIASSLSTIKYNSNKTNPNVAVIGCDDNYLSTSGNELVKGRNFTQFELQSGSLVVIIGSEVKQRLFLNKEDPIDKIICVGGGKYRVIGVLKEKGASMGFSGDRSCLIPNNNARQYFAAPNQSYKLQIQVKDARFLEEAIGESTALFRNIRRLGISEPDNFEIQKSDSIVQMFIENLRFVSVAAGIIVFLTLLGAMIGLMNIMLVSVTERTREIGIRKAIGAKKATIKMQFLTETIVVCQLGGFLGILLGLIGGYFCSSAMDLPFAMPWFWIFIAIFLCLFVGVLSGIYPAIKAANMAPIESLRYE